MERWTRFSRWMRGEHFVTNDQRFHDAVMNQTRSLVIMVDKRSLRIDEWGRSAERMLGYDAREVVGGSLGVVIPPDRRLAMLDLVGGGVASSDEPLLAKDGSRRYFMLEVSPLNGKFLLVGDDVSDRVSAERGHREALARLVEAETRERTRIADALHDDVVQVMCATLMRIEMLRGDVAGDAAEKVTIAEWTLRQAMERTRKMMFDLRPAILEREGLRAAVLELADHPDFDGLEVVVTVTGRRFSGYVEPLAYRTISEAMHNALKHARCQRLTVFLDCEEGDRPVLAGMVGDDGEGFDVLEAEQRMGSNGHHLGLAGMRERVMVTGGSLKVLSAPGMGTSINFTIPILRGIQDAEDDGSRSGGVAGRSVGVPSGGDVEAQSLRLADGRVGAPRVAACGDDGRGGQDDEEGGLKTLGETG